MPSGKASSDGCPGTREAQHPVGVVRRHFWGPEMEVFKWGYPNSWLVFMENPDLKWMMTGGAPMTQETTKWRIPKMVGLEWEIL